MQWGKIDLYCPACSKQFRYADNCVSGIMHSREFGYVCSRACFERLELAYARLVLGKDTLHENACPDCSGTGAEFPGNPRTEKCEACDGTGSKHSLTRPERTPLPGIDTAI